ncbi:MAG: universal stress protein [Gaiellaceae bacterium]
MGTIVAGVDGSRPSVAALRFAAGEARVHGARLRVVHAWHLPLLPGGETSGADPEYVELRRADAERLLAEAVADVRLEADGVELETAALEGRAAKVLVDEARDADLLVVGSRGRGGFAELLLGSVGHQCAQHAACPVAIVRGET